MYTNPLIFLTYTNIYIHQLYFVLMLIFEYLKSDFLSLCHRVKFVKLSSKDRDLMESAYRFMLNRAYKCFNGENTHYTWLRTWLCKESNQERHGLYSEIHVSCLGDWGYNTCSISFGTMKEFLKKRNDMERKHVFFY